MKNMKYVQPSAEIVNVDVEDIITESFTKSLSESAKGMALHEDNLDTLVNEGKIKLK